MTSGSDRRSNPESRPDQQRDRWWLVVAAGLAVFMASVDMSIVNVALPAIERDFDIATSTTEWTVLAYMLPLAGLALPSGRWLDTVGRRQALVFSLTGFALASVAAGLAPGLAWLLGARLVQGTFGALLFSLVPALATTAVRPQARARAMGLITTLGPLGLISGPALGGMLVDALGWSWIFFVNVPVSGLVMAVGVRTLPPFSLARARSNVVHRCCAAQRRGRRTLARAVFRRERRSGVDDPRAVRRTAAVPLAAHAYQWRPA